MSHYAHLLAALCEQTGLDVQQLDEAAAAVDLDGRSLVIHPAHGPDQPELPQALEITVAVMRLEPADPEEEVEALELLHRLNALSLGAHGWRVGVDDEGVVVLRQRVAAEPLGLDELQALMVDGVDRAASVEALLHEQLGSPAVPDQTPSPQELLASSFIKA